jgi:hypothetical protein
MVIFKLYVMYKYFAWWTICDKVDKFDLTLTNIVFNQQEPNINSLYIF